MQAWKIDVYNMNDEFIMNVDDISFISQNDWSYNARKVIYFKLNVFQLFEEKLWLFFEFQNEIVSNVWLTNLGLALNFIGFYY